MLFEKPGPAANASDDTPETETLRARRELIRRAATAAAVPAVVTALAGTPRPAHAGSGRDEVDRASGSRQRVNPSRARDLDEVEIRSHLRRSRVLD